MDLFELRVCLKTIQSKQFWNQVIYTDENDNSWVDITFVSVHVDESLEVVNNLHGYIYEYSNISTSKTSDPNIRKSDLKLSEIWISDFSELGIGYLVIRIRIRITILWNSGYFGYPNIRYFKKYFYYLFTLWILILYSSNMKLKIRDLESENLKIFLLIIYIAFEAYIFICISLIYLPIRCHQLISSLNYIFIYFLDIILLTHSFLKYFILRILEFC